MTSSVFPNFGSTATQNTGTHLMVINIDQSGASPVYRAWFDPADSSLGTGSAPTGGITTTVNTNTQFFTFDRIRMGVFTASTSKFDEFRIGDTWADVSPVPEPSTALLGLLAGVSFLGCYRRK